MPASKSLRNSLLLVSGCMLAAQLVLLSAVWAGYGLKVRQVGFAAAVQAAYHVLLAAFLLWRMPDFRLQTTGTQIRRMNVSNLLTTARLSSIPTAVFLVLWTREMPLLPVVLPFIVVVFATDFLDGMLARRRGEVTVVGRYLDSVSDYLVIIATSVIFVLFRLIPVWLFILILARLILFALGMGYAALKQGQANTMSTFMGKASIFAVMFLYVLEVAEIFHIPVIGAPLVVRVVEYAAAAVVAASVVDKALFLRRLLAGKISDPAASSGAGGVNQ
jgi:phosphatidylglycerophosphate synthase